MEGTEVGLIALGWLLGVISPLIARHGERVRRTKEIGQGLRAEIAGLRVRLAMGHWLITLRFGQFDRAYLTWIGPFFGNYKGAHPAEKLAKTMKAMLTYSDDALKEVAAHGKAEDGRGLSLKKYRLPYLEANLGNLDLFSERAKLLAMELAAQVEIINEEIDQARFYQGLTFDSGLDPNNRARALQGSTESALNVANTASDVLNKLFELESLLPD
jgi:hypothetical protein